MFTSNSRNAKRDSTVWNMTETYHNLKNMPLMSPDKDQIVSQSHYKSVRQSCPSYNSGSNKSSSIENRGASYTSNTSNSNLSHQTYDERLDFNLDTRPQPPITITLKEGTQILMSNQSSRNKRLKNLNNDPIILKSAMKSYNKSKE